MLPISTPKILNKLDPQAIVFGLDTTDQTRRLGGYQDAARWLTKAIPADPGLDFKVLAYMVRPGSTFHKLPREARHRTRKWETIPIDAEKEPVIDEDSEIAKKLHELFSLNGNIDELEISWAEINNLLHQAIEAFDKAHPHEMEDSGVPGISVPVDKGYFEFYVAIEGKKPYFSATPDLEIPEALMKYLPQNTRLLINHLGSCIVEHYDADLEDWYKVHELNKQFTDTIDLITGALSSSPKLPQHYDLLEKHPQYSATYEYLNTNHRELQMRAELNDRNDLTPLQLFRGFYTDCLKDFMQQEHEEAIKKGTEEEKQEHDTSTKLTK